jgi:antitoxin (DNA-binding transcriptional repressor) of toxin-antitoxin stability system
MRCVGLKTLKNKLSEYVRLAAGGETVLVTDRDRVVAEIGPPSARSAMLSDALLLDAFRRGWMTPPVSVGRGPPARTGHDDRWAICSAIERTGDLSR